jgi:hypothetical protein
LLFLDIIFNIVPNKKEANYQFFNLYTNHKIKLMKKQHVTVALFATFLFFAGLTNVMAQDTPFLQFGGVAGNKDSVVVPKTSLWTKITKTPWIIQVGPDVVDDNDSKLSDFKLLHDVRNYYPIHCSAEKYLGKGISAQIVFSSETMNIHHFTSIDLNGKYNLRKFFGNTTWFDPYAVLGGGYTYRLFPHGQHKDVRYDQSINLNAGGGVNIWFFPNAGIFAQTTAKFNLFESKLGGSNYLQLSLGAVFRIGGTAGVTCAVAVVEETKPVKSNYKRSKEAEDAANYLRDILNK